MSKVAVTRKLLHEPLMVVFHCNYVLFINYSPLNVLKIFFPPAFLHGKWVISKMCAPFLLSAYGDTFLKTLKLSKNIHPKLSTASCGII